MPCNDDDRLAGDLIHSALSRLGLTPRYLHRFLKDCGCEERRARLNALHAWARRIIGGRVANGLAYLKRIVGADE